LNLIVPNKFCDGVLLKGGKETNIPKDPITILVPRSGIVDSPSRWLINQRVSVRLDSAQFADGADILISTADSVPANTIAIRKFGWGAKKERWFIVGTKKDEDAFIGKFATPGSIIK
jgi:hypothetical protein